MLTLCSSYKIPNISWKLSGKTKTRDVRRRIISYLRCSRTKNHSAFLHCYLVYNLPGTGIWKALWAKKKLCCAPFPDFHTKNSTMHSGFRAENMSIFKGQTKLKLIAPGNDVAGVSYVVLSLRPSVALVDTSGYILPQKRHKGCVCPNGQMAWAKCE